MNKDINMKQNEYEIYFSVEDSGMKIMWVTAASPEMAVEIFRQKYPCKISDTIHEINEYTNEH